MSWSGSEDVQAIRGAVRELCASYPDAYWRKLDKTSDYPTEFVKALTEAGWLGALIPNEYGGAGLGIAEASVILEEINHNGGNAAAAHAQMYIMGTLLRHGSPEQKQRYLPPIARGELRLQAFGVTEPDAGSETTRLKTTAVRHGDCYRDMHEADDPPLSELGRDQARRLAARIAHIKPAAVWSSPYRRALETAHAITHDVRVDTRLIEMPLVIDEDGSLDFQETPESAVTRMRAVTDEIAAANPGQRVVVVSHAASILACLTDAMRLEAGRLRLFPYYTSVSILRVLGDVRMVGTFGDVAHLE